MACATVCEILLVLNPPDNWDPRGVEIYLVSISIQPYEQDKYFAIFCGREKTSMKNRIAFISQLINCFGKVDLELSRVQTGFLVCRW